MFQGTYLRGWVGVLTIFRVFSFDKFANISSYGNHEIETSKIIKFYCTEGLLSKIKFPPALE